MRNLTERSLLGAGLERLIQRIALPDVNLSTSPQTPFDHTFETGCCLGGGGGGGRFPSVYREGMEGIILSFEHSCTLTNKDRCAVIIFAFN